MDKKTLSDVKVGCTAIISKVNGKGSARKRIMDMGMVPGAEVEVIKKAPLGDPIQFKVKGYHLSLRKNEADLIDVDLKGE